MRARSFLCFVLVISLLITPLAATFADSSLGVTGTKVLAASNSNYTEDLSLYLTSTEAFWKVTLAGGNISVSSVSVPQSVSAFSITLTSYATGGWETQFEIFTRYGFGLLGQSEPYPDGAVLVVNTTSQSDATALANSLSERFGLAFEQIASSSGGFTFFSPVTFATEVHVYFWNLVPSSAGGFASMFAESQVESNDLNYFSLSYSSSSPSYSVAYGGLTPTASPFLLYTQLGLTGASYNYSSLAQSSTIEIHVLGGLIDNASISTFTNNYSNLSATLTTSASVGNSTVPNINATLDFTFPTILAYRVITPSLDPIRGDNVSVVVTVTNVSPSSAPTADDVSVNDSWIYSQKNNFNLTIGKTEGVENLSSSASMTIAYAFTVLASNGTFEMPATPVTYQYSTGANKTANGTAYLNPETIVVGGTDTPSVEATETLSSGTVQAGQALSVNVTIVNKGTGNAFNVKSGGLTKANLLSGSTWSFLANTTSSAITVTNAYVSYGVSWQDAGGVTHNTTTNSFSAVFSFGLPGTPGTDLQLVVNLANSSKSANVSLTVFNNSPNSLYNLTVKDPIPSGMTFAKSFNSSSLQLNDGSAELNVSSIAGNSNKTFLYSINITNPDDNYVFLPANVSTVWNNITIVHYSAGLGLPLGVTATKTISPSQGFVGTNSTILIAVLNKGSLPVYDVSVNSTANPFITVTSSSTSSQQVLNAGAQMNATLQGYFIGTPGSYNSSSAAANFIFAGSNETASSSPFTVTIYSLPQANLTYSATKVEESHNILITVTIINPSNLTLNQISYSLHVPKGLTIEYGGSPNFTAPAVGPNSNITHQFTIITSQPNDYIFNPVKFTFVYQGRELNGTTIPLNLNIGDDLTLRYAIPVAIGLVIMIGTLVFVRRQTSSK